MPVSLFSTFFYTLLALIAFAGNSVLCRLALGEQAIDAVSFSIIRLLSGIAMLWLVAVIFYPAAFATKAPGDKTGKAKGSLLASVSLFVYAITFSLAYIYLDTGVGALVLFAVVQITMVIYSLILKERLLYLEWAGLLLAFFGFVFLLKPSLSEPTLIGFFLMAISGIAWAIYTLKGGASTEPLLDTLYNFVRTLPLIGLLIIVFWLMPNILTDNAGTIWKSFLFDLSKIHLSFKGVWLSIASGAVTSALGYSAWYLALNGLNNIQAGVVQLLVPVIAAIGGIVFSGEVISWHLMITSITILSGVLLVVFAKSSKKP